MIRGIAIDWVKSITVFVVTRWLSGQSMTDPTWLMSIAIALCGFAAYHILTKPYTSEMVSQLEKPQSSVAIEWLKGGTTILVTHLLRGGSPVDTDWLYSSAAVLIGYTIYQTITVNYMDGDNLTHNKKLGNAIDTIARVGTMLLFTRLAGCQSVLDADWLKNTLAILAGFVTYDVVTSRVIDAALP
jgi:hypothetical protein